MAAPSAEIPSTSFSGFDIDLAEIFGSDQDKLRSLVESAKGDIAAVAEALDYNFLRGAISLENPRLFERFSNAHPKQLVPLLTKAREITRGVLGSLIEDEKKREQLQDALSDRSSNDDDDEQTWADMRLFRSMTATSEWFFADGKVNPRLRVIFSTYKNRVIFDSTLDWDDVIFIAYRLMQTLRDDFSNLSLLAPEVRNNLNLKEEFGDRVPKRLSNMAKDLRAIRDQLIGLGFERDDFDLG